jgi:flagellar hook protein FlgE
MPAQPAVSGLQNTSKAMSSVFFDISNGLSIGHKQSRTIFSSLVASSGGAFAAGGTQCNIIQEVTTQGVLQNSTQATHMAIAGNGFFVTSAQRDVLDIQYTRAAMCRPDKNGDLVTATGAYLLGYTDIDDKGNPLPTINTSDINSLRNINVNRVIGIAKATENLVLQANLPSGDTLTTAARTANVKIFDALGARHDLAMNFTRIAIDPATWTLDITCSDGNIEIDGTSPPMNYSINIIFDGQGRPISYNGSTTPPDIYCNWDRSITNADPTVMNLDLGKINTTEGLTCRAGVFTPSSTQDGREFGTYRNVSIDELGNVSAVYSNGQTLIIARVVLANFAAPDQLEPLSGDSWIETNSSGPYVLSLPNTGGIGKVVSFALESSTVDLAEKLTQLIELNNVYAANTKSITADKESFRALLNV